MRTRTLIFALAGLAASLVSSIAYMQWIAPPSAQVQPAGGSVSFAARNGQSPSAEARPRTPATKPPEPKFNFSWRQIESEDYHKYIAGLREIGCPEQTIRDIIIADINKLYADRENPLKAKPQKPNPGSKAPSETPEQELQRLQQLRAVQQEKRWAIKELLGIDIPLDVLPSSGSRDYHAFEVAFGYLPESKRDQVQVLQENYWRESDALKAQFGSKNNAEYQTQYRQLGATLRQELSKILTPQELEDYEIRTSSTAKQLSTQLAGYFGASEDEFRKIYRAKRDYEDTMEQMSATITPAAQATTPADAKALAQQRAAQQQTIQRERTAALTQMNEQLKQSLGDTRYDEYQRSQDRNYDLLARLGARYNLPQDTVLQAYEFQKSFRANQSADGGVPAPAARPELQKQFEEQFTALLGDRAARGYRRINGGNIPLP